MIGFDITPGQGQGARAQPLAAYFTRSGGQQVAVGAGPNGGLSVWTEIAPGLAACLRLDNNAPGTRLSWRETCVSKLRNIYPVGALTLTGSWSQLQSSGSGLATSYTGNRAVSTTSAGAQIDVTVNKVDTYDLWVHFTGRTAGAFCRVDIDGTQMLVNEINDPAGLGFKAFSTYSSVDLDRRRSVKVASGLTGNHAVTLSHGGAANPGGSTLMIEAVAISGHLADPRILPPVWQPSQAYTHGDEVQFAGIYYSARSTGISGPTAPSHIVGIGSDGTLDWRADTRSTYPRTVSIDYPSEREFAARCVVGGVASDIGGQTHGNEGLQSRDVLIDGAPFAPNVTSTGLCVGAHVAITEVTEWQTGTGTPIADCTLLRQITPGQIAHDVTVMGTGPSASFEWFYIGMASMVRWDGETQQTVVDTVSTGDAAPVTLGDFSGQSPANITYPHAQSLGILADVDDLTLRYGMFAGMLPGLSGGVEQLDSFLRPNLEGTSESGNLDWKVKSYVEVSAPEALFLESGGVVGFYSRHVFSVQ